MLHRCGVPVESIGDSTGECARGLIARSPVTRLAAGGEFHPDPILDLSETLEAI